jgi:hypothetical protein
LLDTAYATTHLGFTFTTDEQVYAEQLIAERFNAEAQKVGWDVRLERFGPALPDILYKWDGRYFRPALTGAVYVHERWRVLGQRPSPETSLHLHHESAKRNGELVPALQGPVISKPSDGIGWALNTDPLADCALSATWPTSSLSEANGSATRSRCYGCKERLGRSTRRPFAIWRGSGGIAFFASAYSGRISIRYSDGRPMRLSGARLSLANISSHHLSQYIGSPIVRPSGI